MSAILEMQFPFQTSDKKATFNISIICKVTVEDQYLDILRVLCRGHNNEGLKHTEIRAFRGSNRAYSFHQLPVLHTFTEATDLI